MSIEKASICSPGIAIGKAVVLKPYEVSMVEPEGNSIECYKKAKEMALSELKSESNPIIKAHSSMLEDPIMDQEVINELSVMGPKAAVQKVYDRYAKELALSKNQIMKERASDVEDIKTRMLRCLDQKSQIDLSNLPKDTILCAQNLLPSQAASLDRKNVVGIVTENGGTTSHCAIIIRTLGIASLFNVDIEKIRNKGKELILAIDAIEGKLYIQPSEEELNELEEKKVNWEKMKKENSDKEAITTDGHKVGILHNLGSTHVENLPQCDGVGLLRTEWLFLESKDFPSKEEQEKAYSQVLKAFFPKEVTIRTLDIGGDKTLDYFQLPQEANPSLGLRAIRFCFKNPDIFETQMTALLKASKKGNLRILLPMIASVEDLKKAKAFISKIQQKLGLIEECKIGIMIELPSAAIMAEELAKYADFASIGTNDLIQYTHGADRLNNNVTGYYQSYSPAVFRLIDYAAKAFHKNGKSICVCGEMASNPKAAKVLVGLGIDELSMNSASMASVKEAISNSSLKSLQQIAEQVLKAEEQEEVLNLMR